MLANGERHHSPARIAGVAGRLNDGTLPEGEQHLGKET